jgi:putative membrane protein
MTFSKGFTPKKDERMTEIFEHIKNGFKGMLIGIANAIPGVSGGTIAVVTGIYDRLIFSGTTLLKKDEVGFKTKFVFLATVVVGLLIGIFSGFIFLGELIDAFPIPTGFFFFGLVLGSVPYLAKKPSPIPLKAAMSFPLSFPSGSSSPWAWPPNQNWAVRSQNLVWPPPA